MAAKSKSATPEKRDHLSHYALALNNDTKSRYFADLKSNSNDESRVKKVDALRRSAMTERELVERALDETNRTMEQFVHEAIVAFAKNLLSAGLKHTRTPAQRNKTYAAAVAKMQREGVLVTPYRLADKTGTQYRQALAYLRRFGLIE